MHCPLCPLSWGTAMLKRAISLSAFALTILGGAQAQAWANDYAIPRLVAVASHTETGSLSVAPGGVTYRQEVRAAEVVRLGAPVTGEINGTVPVRLPEGARLYRADLQLRRSEAFYCSTQVSSGSIQSRRACLSNENVDGQFDRLWWTWVRVPLDGGSVFRSANPLPTAVAYSLAPQDAAR